MTEPRPRVLIVEDEAEIRRFVSLSLEREGFEVHAAETLERGLIVRGESREFGMVRLAHTWRTCTGAEAAQTDAAP